MSVNWTELNPAERSKTYHFREKSITFYNVIRIEIRESGKHRIETKDEKKGVYFSRLALARN